MRPMTPTPDVLRQAREKTKKRALTSPQSHSRAALPQIELFQKEDCPFSHRVRSCLTELGLDFIAHSVPPGNALKHEQLIQAGGKDQVPFLIDHRAGVKLYESSAIEAYLRKEYGKPQPNPLYRMALGLNRRVLARADRWGWRARVARDRAERISSDIIETTRGSYRFFRSLIPRGKKTAKWGT